MEDGKSSSPVEELKKQGNELLKQGDVLGAVAKYSEALQHEPTSHVLLSNRSAAQLRLGRAAAALEDALRAVELAPQWAKAHSRVAAAYRALDRLDEAEKAAQDGLSVEASNETLLQIVERIKVQRVAKLLRGPWFGKVADEVRAAPAATHHPHLLRRRWADMCKCLTLWTTHTSKSPCWAPTWTRATS
jgi:tetratricopeptide (TPR) repeat protein